MSSDLASEEGQAPCYKEHWALLGMKKPSSDTALADQQNPVSTN